MASSKTKSVAIGDRLIRFREIAALNNSWIVRVNELERRLKIAECWIDDLRGKSKVVE